VVLRSFEAWAKLEGGGESRGGSSKISNRLSFRLLLPKTLTPQRTGLEVSGKENKLGMPAGSLPFLAPGSRI
jgi:hypothetical protein